MSYLAMSAAVLEDENNSIQKKRTSHNKTQRFKPTAPSVSDKVNSVLDKISSFSDEHDELSNYSSNNDTSGLSNNPSTVESFDNYIKPAHDDAMNLQDLHQNFMNDSQVRDYFRKLSPSYQQHQPISAVGSGSGSGSGSEREDVVLDKLNYMINLLEEQQDQRTGSITEEVVLYCFLGVFMIFVVDSFTKVSKYTR